MKTFKPLYLIVLVMIAIITSSFFTRKEFPVSDYILQDTSIVYKDGTYEAKSQSKYVGEPYWGVVSIVIKNGLFTVINFSIRDSALHEPFDGNYEKHFEGDSLYTQQCKHDWYGVRKYPKKLMKAQDPDKIDALSGATWSYNIFKASVNKALKYAINQPDTLKSR
jgi:major membrane immunogen (membrane-anchored lipoprotein)